MDPVAPYAERVLFGTTLADKLTPWPEVDLAPGPGRTTGLPGRPPELALPPSARKNAALSGLDLHQADARARILHELANHELQAMELLAQALLRWPDAPLALRRGWAATLADEQRHFQLYLDRLRACGGELGEHPVSRYFWDVLGPVDTLDGFVAGLSLGFELANLDFASHWRGRFARAGDSATAEVLQTVYDDEIRHVALGRVWFERWHPTEPLDAWEAALPPPLTPAHARGPRFDAAARTKAGFSTEAVQRLRVAGGSRGRPGQRFGFDAAVEERIIGHTPGARIIALNQEFAVLPMFLTSAQDTVSAPRPAPAFLEPLARAGFPIPSFREGPVDRPWGRTPADPDWNPDFQALSDKCETTLRAAELEHPLLLPTGEVWTEPRTPPEHPWILKAPFSTSGTRRIRGIGALSPSQQAWLLKTLRQFERVVYQEEFDRVLDISVHITVGDTVRIDGITRFHTDKGRFLGADLGPWTQGLAPELARAVHGDGDTSRAFTPLLHASARRAGEWAHSVGYRGPLSIDALVARTPAGLRLHPWLETNARNTLGRVALALGNRLHPRSRGEWVFRPGAKAPPPLLELEGGRIRRACLATSPSGSWVIVE